MNPPVLEMQTTPQTRNVLFRAGDSVSLNLGGMGEGFMDGHIEGFQTVDLRAGADIVSDCSDLSFCADGSVRQIYASNILEHWPHTDTVRVLKEWRRVLEPKGKLWVSVPDFDAAVRLYQKEGLCAWVKFILWGDQAHPLNYHYINFTYATLAKALFDAGFSDSRRLFDLPFGIKDASTHRDNHYGIRVSLNVEATA